ncbi:hypothetical protein SK128_005476 [Halocaridina rubra]|uniref:GON domain-containing protein n=1 Tax=Halocaridina rubra TaxID=373956 RepID=A0AAN9AH42_HALRR
MSWGLHLSACYAYKPDHCGERLTGILDCFQGSQCEAESVLEKYFCHGIMTPTEKCLLKYINSWSNAVLTTPICRFISPCKHETACIRCLVKYIIEWFLESSEESCELKSKPNLSFFFSWHLQNVLDVDGFLHISNWNSSANLDTANFYFKSILLFNNMPLFVLSDSRHAQCSKMCGAGIEFREVTCHAVNTHHWIDPQPLGRGCRDSKRPKDTRKCNLGSCSSGYYWKVKPWKKCQGVCGERGRQRRSVNCINTNRQRVRRSYCPKDLRPRRKQKCINDPCGYTSCEQARQAHQLYVDGEYSLLVGGRNMSIFCYGMNTTEPMEYLTLPAGEEGNFAEFYNKISKHQFIIAGKMRDYYAGNAASGGLVETLSLQPYLPTSA